jgi:nitroreductase
MMFKKTKVPNMDALEALQKRKSVRAYLDTPVSKEIIERILQAAKCAPSGVNMQPFHVCVVSGVKKHVIETRVLDAFESGKKEQMDYEYYPQVWREPYKSRRKETGLLLYKTLGISREDKAGQMRQWKANYRAFDAPVVLYFFLDASLEKGSFLDYGMFLQSIMLAATELGLATCAMASLAEFPSIVKEELGVTKEKVLLCGMALGYEDKNALVNSYRTGRVQLEEFVHFYP